MHTKFLTLVYIGLGGLCPKKALLSGPSEGKMKCYGLVDGRRPWAEGRGPKGVFGGGVRGPLPDFFFN